MTLYVIGSFFPALAARDRVNNTRALFQMGEGYSAIQEGRGLPVVMGGWQSDDS
jgi:hypothetical protein